MSAPRRALAAGALSAGLLMAPLVAQEPDPFYASMLRDGTQALARGDAERAVEDLRIACFGLLEQPVLLGECLVRTALAEAAIGEKEAFLETFRKLELVEERFSGYTQARLPAAERAAFEERALAWVAPQALRAIPAFAALAERKAEQELAALPEAKRLRELERRAAAEPDEPRWKLRLAELELDRERPARALERLDGLPATAGDGAAACLRGRALAALERCEPAVAAFAACPSRGTAAALLEPELACLVELERRDDARALLARAPAALAERPAVAKLAARLEAPAAAKKAAATSKEPAPKGAPATGGKGVAAPPAAELPRTGGKVRAAQPPQPSSPPPLDAETARKVEEARLAMRSARTAADLEAALAIARPLAESRPERAELHLLVGEISYRASRWRECAAAYRRAGATGPADPTQRFYMVVCLFESGEKSAAAALAATGLENLPKTAFAESYLQRIRAAP